MEFVIHPTDGIVAVSSDPGKGYLHTRLELGVEGHILALYLSPIEAQAIAKALIEVSKQERRCDYAQN